MTKAVERRSTPWLIVLRGPSGAGKSTTARQLFSAAPAGTVLLAQDDYRFLFKPAGGLPASRTLQTLLSHNVTTALADGYNVILEGILSVRAYREVLTGLLRAHPRDSHLYYFDVGLDESLRRHRTRPHAHLPSEAEMRGFYQGRDLLGHACERVIPETSRLDETVALIRMHVGF